MKPLFVTTLFLSVVLLTSCGSNTVRDIRDIAQPSRLEEKKAELREYSKVGIEYKNSISLYQYEDMSEAQEKDVRIADTALKAWADSVVSKLRSPNHSSILMQEIISSKEKTLKYSITNLEQKYGSPSSSSSIFTDPTELIDAIINKLEFEDSLEQFKLAMIIF